MQVTHYAFIAEAPLSGYGRLAPASQGINWPCRHAPSLPLAKYHLSCSGRQCTFALALSLWIYTLAMTDQRKRNSGGLSGREASSSYDAWLNQKLAASLADTRPNIPHSEVERRMAERIRRLQGAGKRGSGKGDVWR